MTFSLMTIKHENFNRNAVSMDDQYEYKLFTIEYIDKVVDVFTQTFCRAEPMTHYLHMDEEKYRQFAYSVAKKAVEDELSVITLHKGEVIAFALVEDLAQPGDIPDFDPKFNFILALLDKLGGHYFENKKLPPRHVAHLFITAVAEKYRGKRLSTQVNFQAMDIAAHRGFDFMYCEFTNYINEKGTIPHLKNPKKLIGSQEYDNFILENRKPFDQLEHGATSYLWEIRKDAILKYQTQETLIQEKL